jgi:hypothetical protein
LYTNQQNRKDQRIIEYDPILELTKNNRKIKKRKKGKKRNKESKGNGAVGDFMRQQFWLIPRQI